MTKFLLSLVFIPFSMLFAQNNTLKVILDVETLKSQLSKSPSETQIGIGKTQLSNTVLDLPFPDGTSKSFKIVEYSILPKGTNIDVKTYYGSCVDDPTIGCRISLSKNGIISSIFTEKGIISMRPSEQFKIANEYNVKVEETSGFECKTNESLNKNLKIKGESGIKNYSNGTSLRTYKLAIMVTNEFYADRGGTDASINTEVAATINTLNGIYESDLAVRFVLVSPNNPVSTNVFYKHTAATSTYNQNLNTVHSQLVANFGTANFNIGHCLHNTGGGSGFLNSVCNSSLKGGGWSGNSSSTDMFVLAHEFGHQFNMTHTFSGRGNGCSNSSLVLGSAFEPGSGNTIMSYATICDANLNISGGKSNYFHTNSLETAVNFIQTGTGSTCPVITATGNTAPIANAGSAYTIPKNTPFTLIGSGTDVDANALSYTWEQFDLPVAGDVGSLGNTTLGAGNYTASNSTTSALFRSRQSNSSTRFFPDLKYVLNNSNDPADTEGEDLPNVSRTINFRLTVRDHSTGGGGVHMSSVAVTVDATKGPLSVLVPNGNEIWLSGSNQTITWDVNNTNSLSQNIDVYLSIDGGITFPYLLISNTPNDGSEMYTVSNNIPSSTLARIKVVSKGSLTANFFDISNANFVINSATCLAIGSLICSDEILSTTSGNTNLNLGLSYTPLSKMVGQTRSFSTVGAVNRMIVGYTNNTFTTCQNIYNQTSILVSFRVSKTGTYYPSGIKDTGGSCPYSIYSSNTFNCSNLIGSNAYGSVIWSNSYSLQLNSCTTYYMLIHYFGTPASIALRIAGQGDVYEVITAPAGNAYTYIANDLSTNLVSAQSATANFTNLPSGNYEIYGVMYNNTVIPSSFVGQSKNDIIAGNCLVLSDNLKKVVIASSPCPQVLSLTSPGNNISTGVITKQAASNTGSINATNSVTGIGTKVTYQAKSVQLNAGFNAAAGTVFLAEVGGCN